jgi:hypothetical protein
MTKPQYMHLLLEHLRKHCETATSLLHDAYGYDPFGPEAEVLEKASHTVQRWLEELQDRTEKEIKP